jgi:hypothetical protein
VNIVIAATKACNHRLLLERQFQSLGIPHSVQFVEDHPELIEKHSIHSSPAILVDGQMIFKRTDANPMPSLGQLGELFGRHEPGLNAAQLERLRTLGINEYE